MSLMDNIRKIADKFKSRYEYFRGDKGVLEQTYQKTKKWHPKKDSYEVVRTVGLVGIDLSWFLFCLGKFGLKDTKNGLNKLLLDNALIDKWEQDKQKLKMSGAKIQSTLQLWMVYALMVMSVVGGMKIISKNKNNSKDTVKNENIEYKTIVQDIDIDENIQQDTKHKKEIYNPADKNFVQEFVDENWEDIVIGLLELETYYDKPKLNKNEERYTYGPGLTWVYYKGKKQPCVGNYIVMAENFSEQERWNQVRQHCLHQHECLARARTNFKTYGFEQVSRQQTLGVLFAGYQIPCMVTGIVHRLNRAGNNEQKIIDAFMARSEVDDLWRNGTNKRRWWCAMLYTGKITIDDFLTMDRDAFSNIPINKIIKNGHFVYDDETIQYALQCKNPKKGTVQDFIDSRDVFGYKQKRYVSKKQKSKTVAFNDGIIKLRKKKNKQNDKVIYLSENEYRA